MRFLTAGTALLLLLAFLVHAASFDRKVALGDFVGYWSSGRAFLTGNNPYDIVVLGGLERGEGWRARVPMFVWYPPWGLLITAWFGVLPFWPARLIFFAVNLILLVLAGNWLWRRAGGRRDRAWLGEMAALIFIPSLFALWVGQVSVLILAGILLAVWSLEHGYDLLAALGLFVVALKPQIAHLFLAVLLLWCISRRRWLAPAVWLLALAAATWLAFWINPATDWEAMLSLGGPLRLPSAVLGNTLRVVLGGPDWVQFVPTLLTLIALLPFWLIYWRRFDWRRHLPLLLALSLATMCFGWTADMTLLLPVVIYLLVQAEALLAAGQQRAAWLLLIGLGTIQVLLAVPGKVGVNVFVASAWLPFGSLFLFGWVYLIKRRGRQTADAAGRR